MRDAILFEYRPIEDDNEIKDEDEIETEDGLKVRQYEKVEVGCVKFHQFGVNFDERESGIGSYSSAIIELPDGTLENVPVELVQFIHNDVTVQ